MSLTQPGRGGRGSPVSFSEQRRREHSLLLGKSLEIATRQCTTKVTETPDSIPETVIAPKITGRGV